MVLTCKDCNNRIGTRFDAHLARAQKWNQWNAGSATMPGRMSLGDSDLGVSVAHRDRQWTFNVIGAQEYLRNEFSSGGTLKLHLTLFNPNSRTVSLLHCAFLTLFAAFGYEYALCPNADRIREALSSKSTDDPVIRKSVVSVPIERADTLPPFKDVAAITRPSEFKSFLVALPPFPGDRNRAAVILPGFAEEDWSTYQKFLNRSQAKSTVSQATLASIGLQRLIDPAMKYWGYRLWRQVCM